MQRRHHFYQDNRRARKKAPIAKQETKKPTVAGKRENRKRDIEEAARLEQERALLATIGASDIKTEPAEIQRYKTKTQFAAGALMTTGALISLLPRGNAQRTRSKSTAHHNDNDPDTYKGNNNTVKARVRKTQPEPVKVCEDVKSVGSQSFSIGCSPAAKQIYEKSPQRYQEDVAVTHSLLVDLDKQEGTHCKLQEAGKDPRVHFSLQAPDDMNSKTAARFLPGTQEVQVRMGITNSLTNKRLVDHEVHHLYVSNQNRATKTPASTGIFCPEVKYKTSTAKNALEPIHSYSSPGDVGCGAPLSTREELKAWKNIVTKGTKKLELLKSLLEKSPEELKHVGKAHKKLLEDFKRLASDYTPRTYTYDVSKELFNTWMKNGSLLLVYLICNA